MPAPSPKPPPLYPGSPPRPASPRHTGPPERPGEWLHVCVAPRSLGLRFHRSSWTITGLGQGLLMRPHSGMEQTLPQGLGDREQCQVAQLLPGLVPDGPGSLWVSAGSHPAQRQVAPTAWWQWRVGAPDTPGAPERVTCGLQPLGSTMGTVAGHSTHRADFTQMLCALPTEHKADGPALLTGRPGQQGSAGHSACRGCWRQRGVRSLRTAGWKGRERQGRGQWVPQRRQGASPGHPWGPAFSSDTAGTEKGQTSRQPGQEPSSGGTRLPAPDDRLLRDLPKVWNHSKVSPLVP